MQTVYSRWSASEDRYVINMLHEHADLPKGHVFVMCASHINRTPHAIWQHYSKTLKPVYEYECAKNQAYTKAHTLSTRSQLFLILSILKNKLRHLFNNK